MSPPPTATTVPNDNPKPPFTAAGARVKPTTHHVLMVSLSAQGHVNPMLRLGNRLHSKGLHVTLATPDISRHRVSNYSTATAESFKISGINFEFFSDGLSLDSDRTDLNEYFRAVNRFGPANLSELIRKLHSRPIPKISCIVNNPFVPWVVDVAADQRIPCAMLWIQPCSLFSIYYRFYNKLIPFESTTPQDEILAVDIPGLPLLHTTDLPSFILPSNSIKSVAEVLSQSLQPTKNLSCVLANSFDELETETIRSVSSLIPIKSVGPLVSNMLLNGEEDDDDSEFDLWKADESCITWLDQQCPCSVIYLSFGSLMNLSAETTESIVAALKKTKMPFLWVMKTAEFNINGAGVQAAVLLEGVEEYGRVVTWCPQSRVLKHPSVGCFLTHCGWNSVLEALAAGVPLICYPQWTDQPTNAKLVEEVFGVGVRLWPSKKGGLSANEFERCIEEVMVGPKAELIRARAAEWRKAAREVVADGGSSDRNIQWFVDEIVKL